jgi:hypothetical protein
VHYQLNKIFGVNSMQSFSFRKIAVVSAGAIALGLGATMAPAQAANITSLSDNFDTENGGSYALSYTGFTNWDVAGGGTVDLIGSSSYDYHPGNGHYVDLDGSSSKSGVLTTKSAFAAGQYQLSFKLGGSKGGSTELVTVLLGNLNEVFTIASDDALTTFTRLVSVASPGTLSFANAGGDNVGAILDDVNVSAVPVPTPVLLPSLIGLGLGALRKRKEIVS